MRSPHRPLLAVLLVLSTAARAELDKKQQSLVRRVNSAVTSIQRSLEGSTKDGRQFTPRNAEELQKRLERVKADLAGLPDSEPEVKAELAHLAELEAAIGKAVGDLSAKTQAKEEERGALVALLSAPEVEDDLATLKSQAELFGQSALFELDSYALARWTTNANVTEMRAATAGWKQTVERFQAMEKKYRPAVAYRGQLGGDASMMQAKLAEPLNDARDHYEEFAAAIATFAAKAPAQLEKEAAALKAASDTAVGKKDHAAFTNPDGAIEALRNRVANLAAVWAPLAPSDAEREKIAARAKQVEADVVAKMESLAEAIVQSNVCPAERYAGADRDALEKFVRAGWSKGFPKEAVVAVRFADAAFERHTSLNWEPSMNAFVKRDSSSLGGWVVVKDGADRAIMWPVAVRKLHLKGDQLDLDWSLRSALGAPPNHRLLLAKCGK